MRKTLHFITGLCIIIVFSVIILLPKSIRAGVSERPLPYRFLLVISDQWNDPASYLVQSNDEFKILVTLLKNWGLPFDIMRLDQERFDTYHILDRDGNPRYGTIIWDAAKYDPQGKDKDLLTALVKEQGVNLVILGNTIALPPVAELAGLEFVSVYQLGAEVAITGEHFITRNLKGRERNLMIKLIIIRSAAM